MTKSKVVLPKEVAEAVEWARTEEGQSNYNIVRLSAGAVFSEHLLSIQRWAFDSSGKGSPDKLMQALVNGYEVEQTPEDKLRKFFHTKPNRMHPDTVLYNSGAKHGVKKTLSILGITVEGINDNNTKGCE